MAGIYIHIPFCKQACTYCNFHFSTALALKKDFIQSLVKEITLTENFIPSTEKIESIYFGGGTPSLLSADDLSAIFNAIQKKFILDDDAEITLEANPDDINRPALNEWKQLGINRLSLGIQSFKEEELRWMNRAHTAGDSLRSIDEIQQAGFKNFSADLIFGSPLSGSLLLEQNLQVFFDKNIPHISCYALTVEPKTVLYKMIVQEKSLPVDSEAQAAQFMLLMNKMKQFGYEHYEISNFAKPGMRSKHNSAYWQGKPYYGFGPSAHSFNGTDKRRWNISNNSLYIQSVKKNTIPFEEEILTVTQRLNEYIMTALRTMEGINMDILFSKFGADTKEKLFTAAEKFCSTNKIIVEDGNLKLTNEGKLFADGIASDLFFNDGNVFSLPDNLINH